MFLWVPGDSECWSLCRCLVDLLDITLMQYNADKLCYVPNIIAYSVSTASGKVPEIYNTQMRLWSHVRLSGVSVEVDKEESVSLKDSILNGSSVSLDENTPLLH